MSNLLAPIAHISLRPITRTSYSMSLFEALKPTLKAYLILIFFSSMEVMTRLPQLWSLEGPSIGGFGSLQV